MMARERVKLAAGTGGSVVVDRCQVCGFRKLESAFFLGYLPPVNQMWKMGERPKEQPGYPAEMMFCPRCKLVQLGLTVDPEILFPPGYPYSSGTTRILRENFAELFTESRKILQLEPGDLVVDIGSNDGTLLENFKRGGMKVFGIEPTDMGRVAQKRGIPTMIAFFGPAAARRAGRRHGPAKVVTATNVFAHIEDINRIVRSIVGMLADDGVFISESHYLVSLIETLQYDTIYHEHLRYYSLTSLKYLLESHGLQIVHAKRIPTHGGSIRVYAARRGRFSPRLSVAAILAHERKAGVDARALAEFKRRVVRSKSGLHALLSRLRAKGERVYGVGAPSRASTLVNYVGLDDGLIECVMEIAGSYKIGKYMPGTVIPVLDEAKLFRDQPEYALLFSWHIARELIPKLAKRGFRGDFIVPLPEPKVVRGR